MYAHVIVSRLSSDRELAADTERAELSDRDAVTYAYRTWQANAGATALGQLAAGRPFDTVDAEREAQDYMPDDLQADLFYDWLVRLGMLLSGLIE